MRVNPQDVKTVACVGAGTIGSGWAAYFLARGLTVYASDPAPGARESLRRNVDDAWPKLEALGLHPEASRDRLHFADDPEGAVAVAEFVQESAPDDEVLKIELVARIDAACAPEIVISSSSSRFLPSRIGSACRHPGRVLVGHPFVPAYLVPLVEVVGGPDADETAMAWAADFYAAIGKRPLRLKKEIEAYIANRLQHVVFEEAMRLVDAGVCDWGDVDDAVNWGPGFRWPVVGPALHRHLGGGKGGVRHMLEHFGWPGTPGADREFVDAIERRYGGVPIAELESWRDDNLLAMLERLTPPPSSID